jgi:hypothetical protein
MQRSIKNIQRKIEIVLTIVFICLFSPTGLNAGEIKEPPFAKAIGWDTDPTLGLFINYLYEDGKVIQFAHPVLSYFRNRSCDEYQLEKNRLILISRGRKAWRYESVPFVTAYRIPPGRWQSFTKQ